MAELQQYNTLAEAIAYNLTENDLKELGYINTNGNMDGLYNNYYQNRYNFTENTHYRPGLAKQIDEELWRNYKEKHAKLEFDTTDNIVSCGFTSNLIGPLKKDSNELDLTHNDKFKASGYTSYCCAINGTITAFYLNFATNKINFFGNFQKSTVTSNETSGLYLSLRDPLTRTLLTRTDLDNKGSFYYKPIVDFRWLENKKVIKLSELQDGTFFNIISLIPNYTIGFVYNDTNNTKSTYDEFVADIANIRDIISSYDNLMVFENKYGGYYTVYYRINGVLYFGTFNDISIMAMGSLDTKEDYPLNKNGYIDYNSIDYNKEYTSAIGAAKINYKIFTKMLGWTYCDVSGFTNTPPEGYGVKTKISISQQTFRPSNNLAKLTIELGYTEIDGVRYNDELGNIYSQNKSLTIKNNNDGTYDISFSSTTQPKTDFLYIPVKNTFNGITTDNYYELELVRDDLEETTRLRQPAYTVTVSNCNVISGYLYYERKTALTSEEKDNIGQADLTRAFKYFNDNICFFQRLEPFDPTDIKDISYTDREVLIVFKGKSLASSDQYRAGKYEYNIETISSKQTNNLTITLLADATSPNPNPPKGNPPNNPPSRPGVPPGGGGIGGGGGGGGGGTSPSNPSVPGLEDETEPKQDLNNSGEKEEPKSPEIKSCSIPSTESDMVNLDEYLEYVRSYQTRERPFTAEDAAADNIIAKDYQGHYVWLQEGQIYTDGPHLIPKIYTTHIYRVRYPNKGVSEDGDLPTIEITTWQYAQSFVLVNGTGESQTTETIAGGDGSESFPQWSEFVKNPQWDKYNDDNPVLTDDDVQINLNPDGSLDSISVKWKWEGIGKEANTGMMNVGGLFNICTYTEPLTDDELLIKYNMPLTDAYFDLSYITNNGSSVSTKDKEGLDFAFADNRSNYIGFKPAYTDNRPLLYGTYDFTVTFTDNAGEIYTSGKYTNYALKTNNVNYAYFNTSDIKTANPNFNYSNITSIKFNTEEIRDFSGTSINFKKEQ